MANKRMSYEEELNEEIDPIITESDVPEDGLDKESGVVDGVEALQIARIFQSLEDGDDPTMDPEAGEEDDEESDDTIKVKVSVDTGSDDEGGDDTTTEEEAAAESFWKSFEDDEEGGEEPAADEPAGDEGGDEPAEETVETDDGGEDDVDVNVNVNVTVDQQGGDEAVSGAESLAIQRIWQALEDDDPTVEVEVEIDGEEVAEGSNDDSGDTDTDDEGEETEPAADDAAAIEAFLNW